MEINQNLNLKKKKKKKKNLEYHAPENRDCIFPGYTNLSIRSAVMISYIDDGASRFQVSLMQKCSHIQKSLEALHHKVSPLNLEDPRNVSKES